MVLITGGLGYIGSHTVIKLIESGYELIIVDNLSNSTIKTLRRIERIVGENIKFEEGDLRDSSFLKKVFKKYNIEEVVHFAGMKSVPESIEMPLEYYENNLSATINLLSIMESFKVRRFIFSSSASVYGDVNEKLIKESYVAEELKSPYAKTKSMVESILIDLLQKKWEIKILRYFNPVGAHPSKMLGEDSKSSMLGLVPIIAEVASGLRTELSVYGNNYSTHDGTGIRDFIHVMDLAEGHVQALKNISMPGNPIFNLGTGRGYSVLDVVKAFSRISGIEIPYVIKNRRLGDIAVSVADVSKAEKLLRWKAKRGLEEMCADTWDWQVFKNRNS